MKKLIAIFLVFIINILFLTNISYANNSWTSNIEPIASNSGIVIDANSKVVLYGKNIHQKAYPASITKVLTALVVLEHCKLNDMLTFSHDAVYNVEKGSSSAGYDVGDQISVNDALHAMLIKSANEVANALAQHCAGSIENFAKMMNEKAKSLGAKNSNFVNPSGLNDENHYTTAYDFALISAEAFKNSTIREISKKNYYDLKPSKINKEGLTIYVHHAMKRKNSQHYYPQVIGGKTGYTTLAGNTLVTYAENENISLIAVALSSKQQHYSDTKILLDFGFNNFKSVKPDESEIDFFKIINNSKLSSNNKISNLLSLSNNTLTLPKFASLNETTATLSYDLDEAKPKNALAKLSYTWQDKDIGSIYIISDKLSHTNNIIKLNNKQISKNTNSKIQKIIFFIISLLIFLSIIFIIFSIRKRKKYMRRRMLRRLRKNGIKNFNSYEDLQIKFPKTPIDLVKDKKSKKAKSYRKKKFK